MEVGVRIEAEDPLTGATAHTGSCYLTFVALDGNGKPSPVEPVIPQTAAERRRYPRGARQEEDEAGGSRPQEAIGLIKSSNIIEFLRVNSAVGTHHR